MLQKTITTIDTAFRTILASLMALMVLCVTWQIVSRYFLGHPASWTEELARFLLIWIGLLGGSYAYHVKMHLGLDLLAERLPPKARAVQARFIHIAVILFALTALVGGGCKLIWLTYDLRQYSAALGVPMALVYCSLPISGLMLVFYACIAIFEEPERTAAEGAG